MKKTAKAIATATLALALSASASAAVLTFDYTYDGTTLTTNLTAAGSSFVVGDTVNLTLRAAGDDYWSATAGQNLWAPLSALDNATRTGDATWEFWMNGALMDNSSYAGQNSAYVHIVNFTNPSMSINFDIFKWSFQLTGLVFLDPLQTQNVLGGTFSSPNPFHDVYSPTYVKANVVPEPTSLALMGLGLAGLGFARRRKTAA